MGDQTVTKPLGPDATEARRQAFLLRQELERKRLEGAKLPGTVAEFAEKWVEQYVRRHRTKDLAKAIKMARGRLRDYILPVIGDLRLSEVRRPHLEELASSLRDSGLSVNSQRHVLSDARCLFSYAVEIEEIQHSPFSGRRILPRAQKGRPQPVSDEDLAEILRLCPEPYRSAIVLAARTGMRWGEQRSLQWRHLESGPEPSLILEDTKDGKWRRIPLDAESVEILRRWRSQTQSVYVMPWRPTSPVAPPRRTREVGIRWHWHQLRHWFACDYLRRGGSIEVLSKLLGHASVKTTEIYAGLSESSVRAEFYRVRGTGRGVELATELATPTSPSMLSSSAT
jgi:integrase